MLEQKLKFKALLMQIRSELIFSVYFENENMSDLHSVNLEKNNSRLTEAAFIFLLTNINDY